MRLHPVSLVILSLTISYTSIAQNNEKVITFVNEFRNSIEMITNQAIQFNKVVTLSNGNVDIKDSKESLLKLAKSRKEILESTPVLEEDSIFYYECLAIVQRQYAKITEIDELFNKHGSDNWNGFLTSYLQENKNIGKESNKLNSDMNKLTRDIALKYNMQIIEDPDRTMRVSKYNLAMDYFNQVQLIYLGTEPPFLNVMNSINTHDSKSIRISRDSLLNFVDLSIKESNHLNKMFVDYEIQSALTNYLNTLQDISRNEISKIAKLLDEDMTTNEQVNSFNELLTTLNNKTLETQTEYTSKIKPFIFQITKEVEVDF